MWIYEKKLQYPVKIARPNAKLAKAIISQYGGPDGELGASLRYLSQRYSMPYKEVKGALTDIGTEELAHLEMVGSIIHQLTRDLSPEEAVAQGFEDYLVDHFPKRDSWRGIKAYAKQKVLGQKDNHGLYQVKGHIAKIEYPMNMSMLDHAIQVFSKVI